MWCMKYVHVVHWHVMVFTKAWSSLATAAVLLPAPLKFKGRRRRPVHKIGVRSQYQARAEGREVGCKQSGRSWAEERRRRRRI